MPSLPASVRSGDLVRIRGERWRVRSCLAYEGAALVETDGCDAVNRGVRSRFLLPFEPIDRVDVPNAPRVVRPPEWRAVVRRALADATPSWSALGAAVRAKLDVLPFQLEPAIALLRGDGCRFLIADAVGLGKTVQAGLMLAEVLQRQRDARAIVICPAGLREQWRDELRTRFDLSADILDAGGVARATAMLPMGLNPWSACAVAITSIDYLKRPEVMRSLETLIWDLVILDEAHALAGRSDRAVAAAALASRARILVMLTATPHSGDVEAYTRLCSIGRHGGDDPLLLFSRANTGAGLPRARRSILLRVRPTAAERAMHEAVQEYAQLVWRSAGVRGTGARLAMSVLTRRASSSAGSLERSVERRLTLLDHQEPSRDAQLDLPFTLPAFDDEEPDALLAVRGLSDAAQERAHLTRIQRLARQATNRESKLRTLRRLIIRTSEPAIVFTEYRDTLEAVASVLTDISVAHLHGGLTPRQRADAVRQFNDGIARVLLATDAASEGLNLHHRCRLVVNLELPWTPLRLEQRAGRVDRIGQRRRVHAVHLVARQTCEELVLSKLVARIQKVRAAIGPLAFSPLPTERDVGEAVLNGASLTPEEVGAADVQVLSPDLVHEGRAEAARIERGRALLRRAATRPGDARAVMTSIARRGRRGHRTCVWVFRALFVDQQGRGLRDELLPLTCPCARTQLQRTPSAVRQLLDTRHIDLGPCTAQALEERLTAFAGELEVPTYVWLRREEWLSRHLRISQARLSAQLVQRGLFDKRTERAAASQAACLEEALARSHVRVKELIERRTPHVESCDLTFAVALG